MKKSILFVLIVLGIQLVSSAQKSSVFIKNNRAIDGYDPVAFFKDSMAIKGNDAYAFVWNDAIWYFSSPQNADSFKLNPEKYAPQYGGYCAYGCSNGYKAPTQANTWTILNNKLYFNYNTKVKEGWLKQTNVLIIKANENWEKIKNTP
jgi:YHS domain-containing protein